MINISNMIPNSNLDLALNGRRNENLEETLQIKRNLFLNRKRLTSNDKLGIHVKNYNYQNSPKNSYKTPNIKLKNSLLAKENKINDYKKLLKERSQIPSNGKIDLTPVFQKDLSFSEIEPMLRSIDDYKDYFRIKNKKFYDDFTFDEIISKGSFGVILRGKSKKYKKNFAFKIIFNKQILQQKRENSLRKIKNEISILNRLKHKLINQFYGFYEIADTFCFVLEYEKYGDLSNFIMNLKRNTLSETLIAYIALQLLTGLNFCHQNKIAHLDIKKQNILVDENLNFKICDFSVSTEYNEDEVKLNRIGSSLYISPENISRNKISGDDLNKCDVYSLGVLLYNLAFKSYPFNLSMEDSTNFEAIMEKINEEELSFPHKSHHSELFRDFLNNILQKDIMQRFSVEEALYHPWIRAADCLNEEKEKISDMEKFLISLVTDNVHSFNSRRNLGKNYWGGK